MPFDFVNNVGPKRALFFLLKSSIRSARAAWRDNSEIPVMEFCGNVRKQLPSFHLILQCSFSACYDRLPDSTTAQYYPSLSELEVLASDMHSLRYLLRRLRSKMFSEPQKLSGTSTCEGVERSATPVGERCRVEPVRRLAVEEAADVALRRPQQELVCDRQTGFSG